MALYLEITTAYGNGINATYHRILENISVRKNNTWEGRIVVAAYKDQDAAKTENAIPLSSTIYFLESVPQNLTDCYDYLKTLPGFSNATDC